MPGHFDGDDLSILPPPGGLDSLKVLLGPKFFDQALTDLRVAIDVALVVTPKKFRLRIVPQHLHKRWVHLEEAAV